MGEHLSYLSRTQWYTEGQTAIFTLTFREPAPPGQIGAVIPSNSLTTVLLTLLDLSSDGPPYDIVNDVSQIDIKNVVGERGSISSGGVLTLTLTPDDMAILAPTHDYEKRQALIEITFGTLGVRADAYRIDFVIENLHGRPYVAPA